MGVTDVVRCLADAIDRARSPTNPRHRICLELLRLMPYYHGINNLPAWESAYQGALEEKDDESEMGQLLYEVFELGRFNMYGKFQPAETFQDLMALSAWLAERGIVAPKLNALLYKDCMRCNKVLSCSG